MSSVLFLFSETLRGNVAVTHEKHMLRATMVSLYCNIVLVIIKSTALVLVNSLAIAVDLGISFVGLAVSIILYYSIKLANRPADLVHNYGYGKVEHVCEAMEGVVLIGIAFAMSSQAILHLLHPKEVTMPFVGFVSSLINALINFGGSYYIFKMARKSGSPAIHAEGVHYKMEGVISALIGISFIVSMILLRTGHEFDARHVDPIAALVVSLVLIVPSFKLARKSFFQLLDASVEEESQMEILKQLSRYLNRFCEFKDLKTRSSGRNKFVEFKLVVPEEISFRQGHEIVTFLESGIKSNIPNCEVNIRLEPCKRDCEYAEKGENCPYL
jgi:cation diffusion facilitator family transporter